MKKNIFLVFGLCLMQYFTSDCFALHAIYNEPDSAYIFAYATEKNHNRNGLHFAWSRDGREWHAIGPEHRFLRSDYGPWGEGKRMLDPFLFRGWDELWHCVWTLNEKDGVLAHASSADLVHWGRQSYSQVADGGSEIIMEVLLALGYRERCVEASISGDLQRGIVHKLPWEAIDKLIEAQQLAAYKSRLYGETMKEDPVRFAGLAPVEATLTVDASGSKKISNLLIGAFFEDINYAADGGLYAELIQNRGFEYDLNDKDGRDRTWDHSKAWTLRGDHATLVIDTVNPLHPNNKHYALLKTDRCGAALVNEGFDGIPLTGGDTYRFSLFSSLRSGKGGRLTVRLTDHEGNVYAESSVHVSSSRWKRQEVALTPKATVAGARLEIIPQFTGIVALDMISLFPGKTFRNRRNGLRRDLAQAIADMHPRFVRFPGGCVAHGDGLDNIYHWKHTIGPLESRKPQRNLWGYHQTVGLGYFEYFQFCEDIGAEPIPVVAAGVPCQNSSHGGDGQQGGIPMDHMHDYIQDILDLIEWANADAGSKWGKLRACAGHPEPFNLKYIGVGNEDQITNVFEERFTLIYNAVKAKHPEITVIGTVGPFSEGTDYVEGWNLATKLGVPMVDEHYYQPPGWFIHNQDYYDKYDRCKAKVYLGEYAAHLPGRPSNMETALAEALHLTALERNGDVVSMASYAPLLAKEGFTQWKPDLIYFNNTEVKPTVDYYVQKLYGQHAGDEYLPGKLSVSTGREDVRKRVAASVVRDSQTGEVIVKLVNMLPAPVKVAVELNGIDLPESTASVTLLTGKPGDENARPVTSTMTLSANFTYGIPACSFVVIRTGRRG